MNGCMNLWKKLQKCYHIVILNVKSVDYKCVLWNMTKNDVTNRLSNFRLDDKGTL